MKDMGSFRVSGGVIGWGAGMWVIRYMNTMFLTLMSHPDSFINTWMECAVIESFAD